MIKGLLVIKGMFTQKQLDSLGKMWENLQKTKYICKLIS